MQSSFRKYANRSRVVMPEPAIEALANRAINTQPRRRSVRKAAMRGRGNASEDRKPPLRYSAIADYILLTPGRLVREDGVFAADGVSECGDKLSSGTTVSRNFSNMNFFGPGRPRSPSRRLLRLPRSRSQQAMIHHQSVVTTSK